MGRLPKGASPTPHRDRQVSYRADLVARGGRRTSIDMEPEVVEAVEKIMLRDKCSLREAITAALLKFAAKGD